MSHANAARHLRVIAADDTGEVIPIDQHHAVQELAAENAKLRDELKMAHRDIDAKNRRILEMERDKAAERLEYERYADVQRIATYWHRKCRAADYALERPRIHAMSPERFDAIRGILEQQRVTIVAGQKRRHRVLAYTLEDCKAAVDGAAYDCFQKTRRNGSVQRFDDLELIFRSGVHFEGFRDRAPVRSAVHSAVCGASAPRAGEPSSSPSPPLPSHRLEPLRLPGITPA